MCRRVHPSQNAYTTCTMMRGDLVEGAVHCPGRPATIGSSRAWGNAHFEVSMDSLSRLFPQIAEPQVALLHAEFYTGIILCLDGSRFNGDGDVFLTFATLQDAQEYAAAKIKSDPEIECVIFDQNQKSLEVVRPPWVMDQSDELVEDEVRMRRRPLLIAIVILLLAVWVGAAFYRAHDVQSRAYRAIMASPPAEREKMIAPGSTSPDVRVPVVPLLLNPFKAKPHAYLYLDNSVKAEVTY